MTQTYLVDLPTTQAQNTFDTRFTRTHSGQQSYALTSAHSVALNIQLVKCCLKIVVVGVPIESFFSGGSCLPLFQ